MLKQSILLIVIAVIIIALAIFAALRLSERQSPSHPPPNSGSDSGSSQSDQSADEPPGQLQIPFNISDISNTAGAVNPLGVVRFSKDQGEFGHSGIDIPLTQDAPILAAADGEVIEIKSAGDPWGGQGIWQLVKSSSRPGEGWVYIYEHVTPVASLAVGDDIKTGQTIATKTPPGGFTAHFQMSYAFNNLEFTRGMVCWPDYLSPAANSALLAWWKSYSTTPRIENAWRTNDEEGKFPFRGLLDQAKFPAGPQLCYPPGTDVR